MPMYYGAEVVIEVQRLLDAPPEEQPVGVIWKKMLQIFRENGIVMNQEKLCIGHAPDQLTRFDRKLMQPTQPPDAGQLCLQ